MITLLVALAVGLLHTASLARASHTPEPPTFAGTDPIPPSNDNTPFIIGSAEVGTIVDLFDNPDCTGPALGSGAAIDFSAAGIQVSVADNSSTTLYGTATHPPGAASTCSSSSITYVELSPAAPVVTGTVPPSPADHNTPLIKGTAPANSDVELYDNLTCTGPARIIGTAAVFESPGIQVFVADNSTTTFYAKAILDGVQSDCSSTSVTYVEVSGPPPGPEPPPPCPAAEVPPGPTYNGTNSQGGTVCLSVLPDWSAVTSFLVVGDACYEWNQVTSSAPVAAGTRAFDASVGTMQVTGAFDAGQGAAGTYRDASDFCDTGPVSWSARTAGSPPWTRPVAAVAAADRLAPAFRLRGASAQRVLRLKGVVVEVSCPSEACTASAKGTVSVPGGSKVHRLRTTTKRIAKGGRARLKLGMRKKTLKAVGRALKRRKRLNARVTVTVADAAGNSATGKRTIRLKR